jgi:hypothetical protein
MPQENEVKTAKWLDDQDLRLQINEAWKLIHDVPPWLDQPWLARYGLILQKEYRGRGYKTEHKFLRFLTGDPIQPRWFRKFRVAHQGHLVTLGWLRYLGKEAFDLLGQEPLLERFKDFERFKIQDSEIRAYSSCSVLPGIYKLHP